MRLRSYISLLAFSGILFGKTMTYAQLAKVPFEFSGTHLFFKLKTGESDSLRFIFDTGSTNAMIDSATAVKAKVGNATDHTVSVAGSGGAQSYVYGINQNFRFAGLEVPVIPVMMNMGGLSQAVGGLEGIVGYEILNKYVTRMDFDRKELSFYADMQGIDTTGFTGIDFEFSKGILIPRFPISITLANGETVTGKVMFDTGNASTLLVSTPFSMFHDFKSKQGKTLSQTGRGLNVETQDELVMIRSMAFNGFSFPKMPVTLTVNPKAEPRDGYLGILGIDVIGRFNVIIDYAHKKIYLKPNQAYGKAFKYGEQLKPIMEQ